jgi:hypothetical protein
MSASDKINRLLIKAKIRAEYLINGTVCGYSAQTYKDANESFVLDMDDIDIIVFMGIGVIHRNRIYLGPPSPIVVYNGYWFDMGSGQELVTQSVKICGSFHILQDNVHSGQIIKYKSGYKTGYVRMPFCGLQYLGESMARRGMSAVRPVSIAGENIIYCDYSQTPTIPAEWVFTGAE